MFFNSGSLKRRKLTYQLDEFFVTYVLVFKEQPLNISHGYLTAHHFVGRKCQIPTVSRQGMIEYIVTILSDV